MDMRANSVNAHIDEADLFMSAVGSRNHGRVRGFGCVLDPGLSKTIRGWATPTASDISGFTNLGNKRVFTVDVLVIMLNKRDMRLAEERQERKIERARYNMLLNKLFILVGQQNPNVQEPLYSSHAMNERVMGNMQTLQGQRSTSLPQSQEGGSLMQIPHSQGLPSLQASTNPEGGFQALLHANSGLEVANYLGAEASMCEWFGQGNSDNNPL